MCHLCLEKVLKGLYIKRTNEFPPKIHDLMYFIDRIEIDLADESRQFASALNNLGLITRYPEDLRKMIKLYNKEQTNNILEQTKQLQIWIKAQ